ncbi:MAG: endopeptidase La [Paludibacteraceae bacterium]|nr:endopeptidase La [Paludibacteraceae bacterium]
MEDFKIDDTLPIYDVLPLKNIMLFPNVMLPVVVLRESSRVLVRNAYKHKKQVVVLAQKDKSSETPTEKDLYSIGVLANIVKLVEKENDNVMIVLEGLERIQVEFLTTLQQQKQSMLKVQVHPLPEKMTEEDNPEFTIAAANVREKMRSVVGKCTNMPQELGDLLCGIENSTTLINYVCVNYPFDINEKFKLLCIDDFMERTLYLLKLLNTEEQRLDMEEDIRSKTQEVINKEQREYFLQHQIDTIRQELGDTSSQYINDLKERAAKKKWSAEIAKTFEDELEKLQRMSSHSADYSTQQAYLETFVSLPWNEYSEDNYDIHHARQVLDDDHYGLDKVKERILEYLAVQKMLHEDENNSTRTPILCLYGPPGVGKTSLGKSVAKALGRQYARISLGGLHDEAEIRGHRRTYIGAMPGRIIENIQKVQTSNPVFVLDEIDKIGADYKGDPTSALLEVLDPEQNKAFHDNFLNVDYDLSQVLFIATANTLDTIPRPLLDRMELIEMTGYLAEEKIEIAKRHLLPKELKAHGLKASMLKLNKKVLERLIEDYTRESGVRSLERQIGAICRKVVMHIATFETYNVSVTESDLVEYLGVKRYSRDQYENNYIGVVTGLAWTQVGGEILFIEASLSPSKTPTLTLTGNLGDVMKESATLALGYIKAHAEQFGIKRKDIDSQAVHVHVPEGAIPKDGPSAGITMTTALVSAYTHRLVRPRIAMTGEMTLRGKVLPIGGVKEKILAAKRAGITDLILCQDNHKDVDEIPEVYLKGLTFHYVKDIQEVIDLALL